MRVCSDTASDSGDRLHAQPLYICLFYSWIQTSSIGRRSTTIGFCYVCTTAMGDPGRRSIFYFLFLTRRSTKIRPVGYTYVSAKMLLVGLFRSFCRQAQCQDNVTEWVMWLAAWCPSDVLIYSIHTYIYVLCLPYFSVHSMTNNNRYKELYIYY